MVSALEFWATMNASVRNAGAYPQSIEECIHLKCKVVVSAEARALVPTPSPTHGSPSVCFRPSVLFRLYGPLPLLRETRINAEETKVGHTDIDGPQ